jgi:hypothetical protein
MFYSYTGGEHKNMLVRFSICQINALSSCCYLSKVYVAEKKHLAMQKLFTLEKREKVLKKRQVSKIYKTKGTPMPA